MATIAPLGRCTTPACPWRAPGRDRPCPEHALGDHAIARAAAELGLDIDLGDEMTATMTEAPAPR